MKNYTTTINKYSTKWAIIAPVRSEFNKKYKSCLKSCGFSEIGHGLFAYHFNESNGNSVLDVKSKIAKLKAKITNYKYKSSIFSFIITDCQFGLIGTEKAEVLAKKTGWKGLPLNSDCSINVPVTYNQLYAHGAIMLPCSQADGDFGVTFSGDSYKRRF